MRIRNSSPYGRDPNWQLYSVIVKSGADLRQEQLALQLITEMQRCWEAFRIPVWIYAFSILITSARSGLIEVIPDSISIHSIKKEGYTRKMNQPGIAYTIYDHFIKVEILSNFNSRNLDSQDLINFQRPKMPFLAVLQVILLFHTFYNSRIGIYMLLIKT